MAKTPVQLPCNRIYTIALRLDPCHHLSTHVNPAITMCLLLQGAAKKVDLEEENSGAFNCAHRRLGLGGSAEIRRILSFFGFTSPKKLEMVRRRYLPKALHLVQESVGLGLG